MFNTTTSGAHDWPAMIESARSHLPESNAHLALLFGLGAPVVIILLNALRQILPKNSSDPPHVFHWIPIVGSAIEYGTNPVPFFMKNKEKHGDVFTFTMLGREITAALGAKGNNFVLGGKSLDFNAEDAYTHFTTPVFGTDVVYDVPNDVFMQQKKFVKVALSVDKFRSYVGMIEEEVEDFIASEPCFAAAKTKGEWGSFDVVDVMQEITILTASRTLQGKEIRSALDKSFAGLYNDLDGGFTPLNFLFPNLPLPSYRKRDAANKKMTEFYVDILRKRIAAGEVDEEDTMASLVQQRYKDGRPLKEHEIAHIMIALLMAGQHTSSATGSWVLLHVARNPDVAQAIYDEQVKHFASPDGRLRDMTYEEMRELPVLDSVIRETLRVHPPIHSIMRKVREPVPVPATLSSPAGKTEGVFVVPKGHFVLASPSVSQVDPTVWADAETWEPKRWREQSGAAASAKEYEKGDGETIDYGYGAVSKGTESPYQPFGAGRHRCIGEQFAYLQLGTILATFVRDFELKLAHDVPEHNYHTMIVMPKHPRQIQYRRRQ
ncbi:cytochrome P450 [Pterulicium gracile]|uniref:Cytochrome P450 n=1 Tax=Pterulicium gracile TaxID=1884261 RepID=A0A5C3QBJ8_9AGAR|nr:cytochrome P450 [Pterula gracilis]